MLDRLFRRPALLALAAAVLLVALPLALVVFAGVAHADQVDDWYAEVCGNDGLVFKWLARGAVGVAGAAVLANFKRVQAVPLVGPLVNFVALNWASFLRQAAQASVDTAKKTTPLLALAIGLAFVLDACTGDPTKDAATAQGYVIAFQPLASEVACTAQSGANIAGKVAEGKGDAEGAAIASAFSLANGLFCNGLPAGAPLPQPVASPLPPAALGAAPAIVVK